MKLGVIGSWYHIFQLEGYIFFGTTSRFLQLVKRHVNHDQLKRPRCARDKFIIFDFSVVPGMDATAAIVFIKIARLLRSRGVTPVWAGISPNVRSRMENFGVLQVEDSFPTLDQVTPT